jgi:hypothetical protein
MLVTLIAGNRTHILSGSMSFLIILIIAWVTFPLRSGLESIPPAEDFYPEGSIASKTSATFGKRSPTLNYIQARSNNRRAAGVNPVI